MLPVYAQYDYEPKYNVHNANRVELIVGMLLRCFVLLYDQQLYMCIMTENILYDNLSAHGVFARRITQMTK